MNHLHKLSLSVLVALAAPAFLAHGFAGEESLAPSELQKENALIAEIVTMAKDKIKKDAERDILARRDAHPIAHGCVRANFQVRTDIPENLQVGLFQHAGESFESVIRFSNGASPKPDYEPDTRGLAVKILGVPGPKVRFENERVAETQDFLMVSHPVFVARNVEDYRDFFKHVVVDGNIMNYFTPSFNPFSWRLKALKIAKDIKAQKHANLLELSYFSMTPYAFGSGEVMKFRTSPCSQGQASTMPSNPSPRFLKERLVKDLSEQGACFDFSIQLSEQRLPVDDATVLWDSPFVPVARITIPTQLFDAPELQKKCEEMAFDPWNALQDHRPMGSLNRSRKVVYKAISEYRNELNRTSIHYPQP